MVLVIAGAVQDFQIDDRAGRSLSRFDDGCEPVADRFEWHSREGALVNEIAGSHERQAPDMTFSSDRSMPRMEERASTSSRRASALRTSRKACSMVSLRVAVEST